ncbi:UDP-D-galactose:(glucosyl)lipopolysaccharide-1,6-D-galactosyltransferase [Cecembia lonarensis LW9]|uniref:UDP-D-galactose:(Glucosyl)lipopolysaccharide-1, 6-D-galactosyltransferase n=1 Tax=Cecembia lonarensis (strain CCUG 58316 / KCTC 22772 / LW9) TaxID=1225176 RepID=K1LFR8_CECL9|nr:UDP-D-galactose:(glucosyl)lipopolysaccharide-1,6-D-galactosyltransferase [Cecembia lonarensis LW9]
MGDGPELADLKTYAKKLNVLNRIEFLGFSNEVDKYLAQSKVFVFTSLTEGYPNAIIESMAQGCVPVSFDCIAGPSDIIKHGVNGYLMEVGDTDSMAHYIKNLIQNEDLLHNMSTNSQEVRNTNSLDTLGKLYMDFLLPN